VSTNDGALTSELLEAAHHGRNDQRGKQHHREEQDHEDQAGGHPALPPALREPVDRRLQREGQEQRHPDRGQETRELSEQQSTATTVSAAPTRRSRACGRSS
jgi:hypothetical protein